MDDVNSVVSFLEKEAPFLYSNWPYLLVLCCGVLFVYFLEKRIHKEQKKRMARILREEHPLSEFREDFDPDLLAPSLHSPDTPHIEYQFTRLSNEDMIKRSKEFYQQMNKRRSIREFSTEDVPLEIIENIIKMAGTSPSGAHCEPWTFVVVKDHKTKSKIRSIIEQEEYLNYNHRMGDKWVNDLKFIHTGANKPYLEEAPYLILVFKQQYRVDEKGNRFAHYYYEISTAMACGLLITAIQNAGLVTVTTTPLNAGGQLRELLGRPVNEKVMLLLPVGFPAKGAKVPDVSRKSLDDIMVVI